MELNLTFFISHNGISLTNPERSIIDPLLVYDGSLLSINIRLREVNDEKRKFVSFLLSGQSEVALFVAFPSLKKVED